ncbi:MAG TPA: RNA polymerase sigma factor [Actinomycetota bacterium]|nr:RNA polymerase sigma factor [Actinomycetota bacterium]
MHIDATLVEAARRGDPEAFESLLERTHKAVYGLVYRLVGNHEDAADVMQETYLRIWRSLRSYRGEAAFETWAYRIAANAAMTYLKRRGREAEPVDPATLAPLERAEPSPDEPPDAGALEEALARLPVAMRTVLVMKDVYGFSLAEIAKQVGATEGALKVRVFRARRRLAEELYGNDVIVPMRRKKTS